MIISRLSGQKPTSGLPTTNVRIYDLEAGSLCGPQACYFGYYFGYASNQLLQLIVSIYPHTGVTGTHSQAQFLSGCLGTRTQTLTLQRMHSYVQSYLPRPHIKHCFPFYQKTDSLFFWFLTPLLESTHF